MGCQHHAHVLVLVFYCFAPPQLYYAVSGYLRQAWSDTHKMFIEVEHQGNRYYLEFGLDVLFSLETHVY